MLAGELFSGDRFDDGGLPEVLTGTDISELHFHYGVRRDWELFLIKTIYTKLYFDFLTVIKV